MGTQRARTMCRGCARNRRAIAALEKRLAALESEVNGPPTEDLLEEFNAMRERTDARQIAIREFSRMQEEEVYEKVPQLREAADRQRKKYEAFMRERGFEP
jgi:hypothetical protein